jgi:acyl-CoA hydrolase
MEEHAFWEWAAPLRLSRRPPPSHFASAAERRRGKLDKHRFVSNMIRPVEIYRAAPPHDPEVPRAVRASQVTFADLAEPHSQNVAGTFFGGALLALVDRAAAFSAMKHAGRPVVTKSLDTVEFNQPIFIGELVIVHASVNFTGSTSMEVGVRVLAQNPITGEERHTNTCFVTFVALGEDGRPARVPLLLPETEEERVRFEAGRRRREERLGRREQGTGNREQGTVEELSAISYRLSVNNVQDCYPSGWRPRVATAGTDS